MTNSNIESDALTSSDQKQVDERLNIVNSTIRPFARKIHKILVDLQPGCIPKVRSPSNMPYIRYTPYPDVFHLVTNQSACSLQVMKTSLGIGEILIGAGCILSDKVNYFGIKIDSQESVDSFLRAIKLCFPDIQDSLGIISNVAGEISKFEIFTEGAVHSILVNAYERDKKARKKCLDHYGAICCVCKFDFGKYYGSAFQDFIHVHHIKPISSIGKEYIIDPIADLRPLCPNCHAAVHAINPPYSIEQIKQLVKESSETSK
ncbi:HNH endonuclease [Desulforhabdus amnigena]|uniref:HNH domain-containing protein n=1 Tax=Desulforhabdus amnigena TaxID=40218 RepID=A0A9W6CX34_9BACT|nr:HNH endonuclease [Desulforhabdus amnigena]GLI34199.1 hypothetical protein DAMNIGENAA_16320 [Desulforhabdus amnigena]